MPATFITMRVAHLDIRVSTLMLASSSVSTWLTQVLLMFPAKLNFQFVFFTKHKVTGEQKIHATLCVFTYASIHYVNLRI